MAKKELEPHGTMTGIIPPIIMWSIGNEIHEALDNRRAQNSPGLDRGKSKARIPPGPLQKDSNDSLPQKRAKSTW